MISINRYPLEEYISRLNADDLITHLNRTDFIFSRKIQQLTFNSKDVTKDTMFICKGINFKQAYLEEAIEKGACVYVSETKYDVNIPSIIVSDIRKAMPVLADLFYEWPQRSLKTTAVTGTKGKSTTIYFIKSIIDKYLLEIGAGESAIVSTIDTYDGVSKIESKNTTPEAIDLYRHCRNAVDSGINFMELEVSSQALKYHRVDNIPFEVAVMTNISEDHISPVEHADFEDYFKSKLKMFDQTRTAILFAGMDHFETALEYAKKASKVITYGYTEDCDYRAYNIRKVGHEIHFNVKAPAFDEAFVLTVPGLFNVENAAAAIAACDVYGFPVSCMQEGLRVAHAEGRMDMLLSNDGKVSVIVDYAHNKLSFEKLFESVREEFPDYKVSIVFGCPGEKAYQRRRDLGLIAGQMADKVYLTIEDPGKVSVREVCEETAVYVKEYDTPYVIIEDRGEAIKAAVEDANEKTVILITGKGTETRDKIGTEFLPRPSDLDYGKQFLAEYNKSH